MYMHFWLAIPIGVIFLTVFILLASSLTGIIGNKYSSLVGFKDMVEIPALSTWIMLFMMFYFIVHPVLNLAGYGMERQADYNGARLSGKAIAGARYYAGDIRRDKFYPDPPFILNLWVDSHPATGPRVRYLQKLDKKFGGGDDE